MHLWFLCLYHSCVFESHSPGQVKDAEEGRMLLEADAKALLNAAEKGFMDEVGHLLPHRLSITATTDCTCTQADARTLIPLRPPPLSAL